jgi:drug/metabolite transporter (DMT)-like permease
MTDHEKSHRTRIVLAFASVYLIWGSTYLAIRYAVETMPPFLMAGARFVVSGAILYAWSRARGTPPPTRRHWRNAVIAGTLLLVGGNGAVVWAEQYVPSGLTALLVSVVPFWLVVIDWLRPGGRAPGRAVIAGLILGLIGIFVLVNPTAETGHASVNLTGAAVLMLGSILWALGSFFSSHSDLPSSGIMRTGLEMLGGGVVLFFVAGFSGEFSRFHPHEVSRASVIGLLYLTTFGALLGFTSYIWLLDKVSPARAGTYAYVNPVVAVLLGWAVAGEALSSRTLVAAAIVIGAVALITTARSGDEVPA